MVLEPNDITVGDIIHAVIALYDKLHPIEEEKNFDTIVKIEKAYDDGYETGYLQGMYDSYL